MFYTLLTNYNNYYNRTFKKENTVAEYIAKSDSYITKNDKSYNINFEDEINIEQVFNVEFDGEPNYILLLNESDSSINSRYFIVEWKRTRKGQYKGLLRRDLLADYYNIITTSPAFIEKGWVPNTDSAIFNKEDMTFNQIKTSEQILRDDSKTSWIVGYIAQNHQAKSNVSFTYNPEVDMVITSNFSAWSYASLCDGTEHLTINKDNADQYIRFWLYYNDVWSEKNKCYNFNNSVSNTYLENSRRDNFRISPSDWNNIPSGWRSYIDWNTCIDKVYLDNPSWISTSDFNYINSLVGKTIQFNDGIYRISLASSYEQLGSTEWQNSGNLFTYISSVITNNLAPHGIESVNYYPVSYKMMLKHFSFTATQVTNVSGTYHYSIPQTVRKLTDAPYKMFCIPYYKDVVTTNTEYGFSLDGTTRTDCNADLMIAWAMNIAETFGSELYDLQILPYCPLSNWRGRSGTTNAAVWSIDKTNHIDYEYLIETIGETDYSRGIISFCDVSTKEQVLNQYSTVIGNPKIANQCYTWRLCSPNYASVFEFNAAMNGGVDGYNIRYTYKPYNPFINVAPVFSKMYGRDFKDNRGLILSGDFSLPIVTDLWKQYQINNKNYQLAFDRQIENMEVQYNWQRKQGIANAITGTLQGGTTGAMAGGMAGGVPGAIAGAVVGTAASAVGGVMDLQMQQALHNEAVDFSRDNFGYQLGNIKALPNTLNKVSSLVANSKFFPFVEYYSCTDEERQALVDKIKYNGMSVGRIGHIIDFKNPSEQTYIKGQLIRIEGKFDTRTANEIANEFMKGWYI